MKKISLVLVALFVSIILPTINADASIVMEGSSIFTHANFDSVVYWEVYSPYDEDSPLGEISDFGYFYQIHNAGTGLDYSITQLGIGNPLRVTITGGGSIDPDDYNIGSLYGDVAPSDEDYGGETSALWTFQDPRIGLGKDSYVLYFTSPYAPSMVEGGMQAGVPNAAGPVPGPVPEPASVGLMVLGLAGFAGSIRRKFMA